MLEEYEWFEKNDSFEDKSMEQLNKSFGDKRLNFSKTVGENATKGIFEEAAKQKDEADQEWVINDWSDRVDHIKEETQGDTEFCNILKIKNFKEVKKYSDGLEKLRDWEQMEQQQVVDWSRKEVWDLQKVVNFEKKSW